MPGKSRPYPTIFHHNKAEQEFGYTVYSPSPSQTMPQRVIRALRNEGGYSFALHGQPIKPVWSKYADAPEWYELLLRLNDPIYGLKPPIDFLPGDDHPEILEAIDYWVLEQAAELLRRYPNLTFSVNFTKHLLQSPLLCSRLSKTLAGLNASERLHLEISERYIWSSFDVDQLKQIHAIVRLHLDDIGQARLNELVQLPIDGFKIDGSLISAVRRNEKAANLVLTLIEFAAGLDLVCVCEFVSDADIWSWLQDAAQSTPCKLFVQGHGVGPVMYRRWW